MSLSSSCGLYTPGSGLLSSLELEGRFCSLVAALLADCCKKLEKLSGSAGLKPAMWDEYLPSDCPPVTSVSSASALLSILNLSVCSKSCCLDLRKNSKASSKADETEDIDSPSLTTLLSSSSPPPVVRAVMLAAESKSLDEDTYKSASKVVTLGWSSPLTPSPLSSSLSSSPYGVAISPLLSSVEDVKVLMAEEEPLEGPAGEETEVEANVGETEEAEEAEEEDMKAFVVVDGVDTVEMEDEVAGAAKDATSEVCDPAKPLALVAAARSVNIFSPGPIKSG
mmetsp:Transcript_13487/g.26171  ORF Transcript_13487/g.26171 Transcript_13487/m.26171 type:complete len:281 (-) Transcript_13487:153-995(-)